MEARDKFKSLLFDECLPFLRYLGMIPDMWDGGNGVEMGELEKEGHRQDAL